MFSGMRDTLVYFVHTVQMFHPCYPIRCGESRLIGIISGQSNQKQSKLRTSLPYMGRNIDCCGQNVPVCHASRKTLLAAGRRLLFLGLPKVSGPTSQKNVSKKNHCLIFARNKTSPNFRFLQSFYF